MKRFAYIAVFTLAGEFAGGFLALLIGLLLMNLWAAGYINHPFDQCMGVISTIAFVLMVIGGFLGFAGGKHFWPILYNEDGSLRFHNWSGFKARLRNAKDKSSKSQMKSKDQNPNSEV